jgi:hypothetical protein
VSMGEWRPVHQVQDASVEVTAEAMTMAMLTDDEEPHREARNTLMFAIALLRLSSR